MDGLVLGMVMGEERSTAEGWKRAEEAPRVGVAAPEAVGDPRAERGKVW